MFNKLVNKGNQAAGKYLREQLAEQQGTRPAESPASRTSPSRPGRSEPARGTDDSAIAKYRYMLRTAPPEDMERAHAEAFARLNPEQRATLQTELGRQLPMHEQPATGRSEDLARSATRAEVQHPGFMEKVLGRVGGSGDAGRGGNARRSGPDRGGLAAGAAGGLGVGLLAGVAGGFIGSAVAGPLLENFSGVGQELAGAAGGLGEFSGGLDGTLEGDGDTASGLGDAASTAGGEALSEGGGSLGGLFGAGEDFLKGGGDGFLGGGGKF